MQVIDAMHHYTVHQHANVHRASYPRAAEATRCYETARQRIATFINASAEHLSLQPSSTVALNMLAQVAIDWQPGDEILVSAAEHHANFIPWQMLANKHQLKLVVAPVCRQTGVLESFDKFISARTRLIALTM
ncbi:cysteine desulfurase, partial [Thalassospira xiamenensis]